MRPALADGVGDVRRERLAEENVEEFHPGKAHDVVGVVDRDSCADRVQPEWKGDWTTESWNLLNKRFILQDQWRRQLLGQAGAQPGHDGLEMGHTLVAY